MSVNAMIGMTGIRHHLADLTQKAGLCDARGTLHVAPLKPCGLRDLKSTDDITSLPFAESDLNSKSATPTFATHDGEIGYPCLSCWSIDNQSRYARLEVGMPLTQHELELKNMASERIRRKMLPAEAPKTIWAGPGTGKACSLCDRTVESTETEYELNAHMDDGSESTVRFHLRCHALWQLELARLAKNS